LKTSKLRVALVRRLGVRRKKYEFQVHSHV
jgi:hypothetical protein